MKKHFTIVVVHNILKYYLEEVIVFGGVFLSDPTICIKMAMSLVVVIVETGMICGSILLN